MAYVSEMDTLSPAARSAHMSRVRAKDTGPEMVVRRLIHSLGYRYRLHDRRIPGCPDLVFKSRRKAIFIHGCFWHRHICANGQRVPKSRISFWRAKLGGNKERDQRIVAKLRRSGWSVLVLWECELACIPRVTSRVRKFLEAGKVRVS